MENNIVSCSSFVFSSSVPCFALYHWYQSHSLAMAPEIRSSNKLGNADRRFDSLSAMDASLQLTLISFFSYTVLLASLVSIVAPGASLYAASTTSLLSRPFPAGSLVLRVQIFSHLSFQEHATAAPPLFDSTSYVSSDSISRNSAIAVDTNAFIGGMTKPRNNGMVVIVPPLSLFSRGVETTPSPLHRDTSFVGHTVHLQQTSRIPAPDESVIGGRRAFWSIKLYDSMPFAEVEDDEHLPVTVRESNASVAVMVESFARNFLGGSKVRKVAVTLTALVESFARTFLGGSKVRKVAVTLTALVESFARNFLGGSKVLGTEIKANFDEDFTVPMAVQTLNSARMGFCPVQWRLTNVTIFAVDMAHQGGATAWFEDNAYPDYTIIQGFGHFGPVSRFATVAVVRAQLPASLFAVPISRAVLEDKDIR